MQKNSIDTLAQAINPLRILIFFALLSSFALIFHIPEKITAILYLSFFFLFTVLNPINGIAFIVFSIPFFLGAPHKPYFFLFEILIYGTLLLGFIHLRKRKIPIVIPFKHLIILLFLSYLFSLPINAKEYYYEFWATPLKDLWFQWLSGHEKFPIFHLRTLFNNLSGILLFILVSNLFSKDRFKDLEKISRGIIWMSVMVCLIGIFFLFKIIPPQQKTYLSLSLAGIHNEGLSVFAFNRQYLAQYLLLIFPIIFYFLSFNRHKVLHFSFYLFVLGLFVLSLSASMQRSAYLVLFLEMLLLVLFYVFLVSPKKKMSIFFSLIPFLLLATMILVDFAFLNKHFFERLTLWGLSDPDNRRVHLWNTAWHMFTFSPLLGIGLGKYSSFFPEFFKNSHINWKTFSFVRGEPHSFYLQTLAEQGAVGFLLLMSLVAGVIYCMVKNSKEEPSNANKLLLIVLQISVISWFLLGFFHNVSYVRSLGVLFWILLGWSAALIGPKALPSESDLKNRSFLIGLLVIIVAFGYQIKLIHERPVTPFFQTGSYNHEILPSGEKIQWMGKRAVMNTKIEDGAATITVSAPLPEIQKHPQRIRLWAGKNFREFILNDDHWHKLIIPTDRESKDRIPLKIETGRTFNPKEVGISQDNRNLGIMIQEID